MCRVTEAGILISHFESFIAHSEKSWSGGITLPPYTHPVLVATAAAANSEGCATDEEI